MYDDGVETLLVEEVDDSGAIFWIAAKKLFYRGGVY
jgi:hypothetical protein